MANLLQHIAALLLHIQDCPAECAEAKEAALAIDPHVVDAVNNNLDPYEEIEL